MVSLPESVDDVAPAENETTLSMTARDDRIISTDILSRTLFPDAKIFSITTGAAVMKMNYEFGFRPVPFAELTDDPEFWKGCEGCRNFDILTRNEYRLCLCTGLLFDPKEHFEIHHPGE